MTKTRWESRARFTYKICNRAQLGLHFKSGM